MNKILRDIGLVGRNELQEAVRSRRAIVILVLYLVSAVLSCNAFISILHRIENQVAEVLQIQPSAETGGMTETLWKSDRFKRMVRELVQDDEVANGLFGISPIVLIYGWLAFMYTPLLVLLSTSSRIAEDVAGGAARFVLFRTPRLPWVLGKFLGQAGLVFLALMLNAVGAWCVARFRIAGLDGWAAAHGMLVFGARAWLFTLPFLGLALGVSQLTRSANVAVVLSFVAMTGLTVLYWVAKFFEGGGWKRLWALASLITPQAHRLDLWRMDAPHLLSAAIFLTALGWAYLMAGFLVFARRDV